MKLNLLPIVMIVTALLTGCNTLKKRCEETNWFEYGKTLGLSGKYPDEDQFYGECKKAEAKVSYTQLDLGFKSGRDNYCTTEGSEKVGRDGKHFNYKICEGGASKSLLERSYKNGLNAYCKAPNGFEVGRLGQIYEKVCTDDQERTFMPEYKKGRKIWLAAKVDERRSLAAGLRQEIGAAEGDLRVAQNNLSYTRGRISSFKAMNASAPVDTQLTNEESNHASAVRNAEYNLSSKRTQLSKVEEEIRAYELERRTLDN